MSRDGAGTYSLPSGNPVSTGTAIESTWANTTLSDIGDALSASLVADGQKTATADQPMGTKKHTGVGNATSRTNYAAAGQVQDASLITAGTVAGTDTITASLSPAITAYAAGMLVVFEPAATNAGAATINLNGVGAKSIVKWDGDALAAGDLVLGVPALLVYDGTSFYLLNPQSVIPAAALAALLTVDGAGSGLDADLLDGQSSAAFAAASHAHSAADVTSGTLAVARGGTGTTTSTGTGSAVLSASPTLTGTVGAAAITATGTVTGNLFSGSGASLTSIPETAITDGAIFARVASTETISGAWTYSTRPQVASAGGFLSHASASNTGGSIIITNVVPTDTTGMNAGDVKLIYS